MYMTAQSIDDVMRRVLTALLRQRPLVKTTRGECREINGALLRLTRPRARLSRSEGRGKPVSALGELLWYLAGSRRLDFIEYYIPAYRDESEDGRTVRAAYGPRLFRQRGSNQVKNVLALLRRKPTSRRAVIQLFDASDLDRDFKEAPCTCTCQFLCRGRKLHMIVSMRSNDAVLGLPHDVFAFTMIQELVARSLGLELGTYDHAVGNLHMYTKHESKARRYIDEGWQSTICMPAMPPGDPWPAVKKVLNAERRIRAGDVVDADALRVAPYWADLVRLLNAFRVHKTSDSASRKAAAISAIRKTMASKVYDPYLQRRQDAVSVPEPPAGTLDLFSNGDAP